jgi:hypothetical protein
MSMRKTRNIPVFIALLILVLSLPPGVAIVWAEVDSDPAKVGPDWVPLTPTPPAQGEGSIERPLASFDDMLVQFGKGPEDVSVQSDNSGVQVVPGASFIHTGQLNNTTQAEDWFFSFAGGYLLNKSSTDPVCLAAPVYLPPGSVIKSFTAYVYDGSTSDNLIIYFDRTGSWGGWDELAAVVSTGSSSSIQTLTDPSIFSDEGANVVAPAYNYHVDFCFPIGSGDDIRVYGAQVNYSAPAQSIYLPIVLKAPAPVVPQTSLYIKNESGGVIYYYRIYDAPQGNFLAECPDNIQDGAEVFCGTFTPGIRYVVTDGQCGPGSGNVSFPAGTCVRTVRCGRDPTTMDCN